MQTNWPGGGRGSNKLETSCVHSWNAVASKVLWQKMVKSPVDSTISPLVGDKGGESTTTTKNSVISSKSITVLGKPSQNKK